MSHNSLKIFLVDNFEIYPLEWNENPIYHITQDFVNREMRLQLVL